MPVRTHLTNATVPTRGADGYFHPTTEDELVALVDLARLSGRSLRVRGSGHSIPTAIHSDGFLAGRADDVEVLLDRYTQVVFDDEAGTVTAQAGCRLGDDPRDPTGLATFEVSLLAQLERRGLALPDLGGVTHQTVAGFFMTGSCGGTVRFSNEDVIVGLRFIDGEGRVHDVRPGDALFDHFGCSMGLLGVLSTMTFACVPRYDILGREDVEPQHAARVAYFEAGERGLEAFLRDTDYARLMWWPQEGVERMVTWQASRMRDEDYDDTTGPKGALVPKPYDAMRIGLTSPTLTRGASYAAQWAGGKFYDAIARTRALLPHLERRVPRADRAVRTLSPLYERRVLPTVLDQFVPLDAQGPQRFWDTWWHGLPMDNQMSDACLPTTFTEIWVPLEHTHAVMNVMLEHFRAHGHAATGAFLFEIYAARASRFAMHPAYGRDSLRIDVFWFERNTEDPVTTFFPQFWRLLEPFGYRLHWGKHLPAHEGSAAYLRAQVPLWDEFLEHRRALDPHGIFLNAHFARALGIAR